MNEQPPIALPAILTLAQWNSAESAAKKAVRASSRPPRIEDFQDRQPGKYGKRFSLGVTLALAAIILSAFIVSVGKQLVSLDAVYGYLATARRLSELWVSLALVAGVMFAEISAFVFMLAPAFWDGAHKRIFLGAAVICAGIAVLGNVAATYGHDFGTPVTALFAWVVTLFAPGIVLVGTLMGERMVLEYFKSRSRTAVEFEMAQRQFTELDMHPEKHPDYPTYLRRYWLESYRKALKADAALLTDPELVNQMMVRDWTFYAPPNFSQPSLGADTKPALTSGELS